MVNKKFSVFIILAASLFICLSLISASVEIKKEVIAPMAIKEVNFPAIYKLIITNNGAADSFALSSLSGIDIMPNESFSIAGGQIKEVVVSFYPKVPLKISPDYLSFEYVIKGENTPTQVDKIALTYVSLKDAFSFYIEDINPESTEAVIHLDNKAGHAFENIKLELSSLFFSGSQEFSLGADEQKVIRVAIDKKKTAELLAGPYIVDATLTALNNQAQLRNVMNFNEKEGIRTTELSEGKMINRYEVDKDNQGNTNTEVTIVIKKGLFASLFTGFNIDSDKKEYKGLSVNYIFRKNLAPGQSLKVVATTNWWILVFIIIAILIIIELIDSYVRNKITMKKRVSLVRTKGGEFALKVSIRIKARDFVEKIRIFDRMPPMVKVFEKYGFAGPDKIDQVNRRLEWNIQALGRGEEREFSYIIYSKIGVVGRFELSPAQAVYEFKGKIKDAESNTAYFKNEPGVRKD